MSDFLAVLNGGVILIILVGASLAAFYAGQWCWANPDPACQTRHDGGSGVTIE